MLLRWNHEIQIEGKCHDHSDSEDGALEHARHRESEEEAAEVERIPADGIWSVCLQLEILVAANEERGPCADRHIQEEEYQSSGIQKPRQRLMLGNDRHTAKYTERQRPKNDRSYQPAVLETKV